MRRNHRRRTSDVEQLGHYWIFSMSGGMVKNTMIYGCVIGDTEKKISCTTLLTPPADQTMIIDWSKPSAMDMPPMFRTYASDADDIRAEMRQQLQSQDRNEGDNNNDEDDDNNNNDEDD